MQIVPLSDLAESVSDPLDLLIAKESFKAALKTKCSSFWRESLEGRTISKAEDFVASIADIRNHEDVRALPCDQISTAAEHAATALTDFRKTSMLSWTVPLDVEEKRIEVAKLFKAYDAAIADLSAYESSLRKLRKKLNSEAGESVAERKKNLKSYKDRVYAALLRDKEMPRCLAKVATGAIVAASLHDGADIEEVAASVHHMAVPPNWEPVVQDFQLPRCFSDLGADPSSKELGSFLTSTAEFVVKHKTEIDKKMKRCVDKALGHCNSAEPQKFTTTFGPCKLPEPFNFPDVLEANPVSCVFCDVREAGLYLSSS